MPTLNDIMSSLKKAGSVQTQNIYAKHGAPNGMFGVKVADMKKIAKTIKGDHEMGLKLFATGNPDAMYLASMVADGSRMKKSELNKWARDACWYMVSEYAVPEVAVAHRDAVGLANKWIAAKKEHIASCGWATYAKLLGSKTAAQELNIDEISKHIDDIESKIHDCPNRVRYTMNGFVIAAGGYLPKLTKKATAAARRIGKVHVEMGETSCKVPFAPDYIAKMHRRKK